MSYQVKVGDIIKFDRKDSFLTYIGAVVSVAPKSVVVKYADFDDFSVTERVKKSMICGYL